MSVVSRVLAAALVPSVFVLSPDLFSADIDPVKAVTGNTPGFRPLVADDRPAEPTLAPASNEGQIRLKQFQHAPDLQVNLWAAEPMLANPVAFSVDEKGRVFTSETYRYRTSVLDIRHYMFMLEDDLASRTVEDRLALIRKWFGPAGERALSRETEVVRLLEDTNHDGKADQSQIFADGFTSPLDGIASGVLARNGEVWLTDIPSVWKVSPNPAGKDVPSEPRTPLRSQPKVRLKGFQAEELLHGFGVRFSFTGHDLHGLKLGPDGRLYFSVGDRGAHVVTQEGNVIDLPDEGAVFRCEPDGSRLEVVHRGLRNPQELAFNEFGDLFTGDNDSDQGDRERWVQVLEGADSGWRVGHQHAPLGNAGMWNMERLWVPYFEGQASYIVPPIANIGDGPSGLVYDYGTSLPANLKNRFLLAYFKGTSAKSGIVSLAVRPAGGSYELVAHDEFLWNSLVPDVDLAPDGSIFFADWHEGWPKSNKGRLYRAYFPEVVADPVVRQAATLLGEGFQSRGEDELLGLLAHRDMRVRQEAQFELARRGPKSLAGLKKSAFESANLLARIHSLWGMGQIVRAGEGPLAGPTEAFAKDLVELLPLLKDPDSEIRTQAARLLGNLELLEAADPLAALIDTDASGRVRASAALALSKTSFGRRHLKEIAGPTGKFQDPATENSARHNPGPVMVKLLTESSASDRGLRHAATLGLQRSLRSGPGAAATPADPLILERLRAHPNSQVRLATVVALRGLADPGVAWLLTDSDPLVVLEAARAINDVPITGALPALAELAESTRLDMLRQRFAGLEVPTAADGQVPDRGTPVAIRDVRADQPLPWTNAPIDQLTPMLLRVVNANFRVGSSECAQRLARLAVRDDLSELIRAEAVYALFHWGHPPARDRIVGTYRPLPKDREVGSANDALSLILPELLSTLRSPELVIVATCEYLRDLPFGEAAPYLEVLIRDGAAPAQVRAAALRPWIETSRTAAQRSSKPGALDEIRKQIDAMLEFAAAQPVESLRLQASKIGAEINPNNAAGQLSTQLATGTLAEQQSAYTSLGDLKSDSADAILAEALDKLMKREIANEVMLDLVDAAAKRDATAVKSRLVAYQKWKLPQDHLSPYREALFGGSAARGRKIFFENAAVACTRCHQIGTDGGGNAGPKLDGLASRATREHLLESIVFPNQQVVPGFESAIITLKNGESYAGVVKSENETTLVILAPEEGDVTLKKSDIASRDKGLSGMPEGMGELLTRPELRDVIEFLGTLK